MPGFLGLPAKWGGEVHAVEDLGLFQFGQIHGMNLAVM